MKKLKRTEYDAPCPKVRACNLDYTAVWDRAERRTNFVKALEKRYFGSENSSRDDADASPFRR